MDRVVIDADACKGCRLCARACPKKILDISKSRRNSKGYNPSECIDPDSCTACKSCALTCPDLCITIYKD